MSIPITGKFGPSGGPASFKLYDPADLDSGTITSATINLGSGSKISANGINGEIILQTGSGSPVHTATNGVLYWDANGFALYASQGGGTWSSISGGGGGGTLSQVLMAGNDAAAQSIYLSNAGGSYLQSDASGNAVFYAGNSLALNAAGSYFTLVANAGYTIHYDGSNLSLNHATLDMGGGHIYGNLSGFGGDWYLGDGGGSHGSYFNLDGGTIVGYYGDWYILEDPSSGAFIFNSGVPGGSIMKFQGGNQLQMTGGNISMSNGAGTGGGTLSMDGGAIWYCSGIYSDNGITPLGGGGGGSQNLSQVLAVGQDAGNQNIYNLQTLGGTASSPLGIGSGDEDEIILNNNVAMTGSMSYTFSMYGNNLNMYNGGIHGGGGNIYMESGSLYFDASECWMQSDGSGGVYLNTIADAFQFDSSGVLHVNNGSGGITLNSTATLSMAGGSFEPDSYSLIYADGSGNININSYASSPPAIFTISGGWKVNLSGNNVNMNSGGGTGGSTLSMDGGPIWYCSGIYSDNGITPLSGGGGSGADISSGMPWINSFIVTPPDALQNTNSISANVVDTNGYSGLLLQVVIGSTDAPMTEMKLQESADNVSWFDINDADYSVSPLSLPTSGSSNTVFAWKINLAYRQRYIRPVMVAGSGTNGMYISVLADLFSPNSADSGMFAELADSNAGGGSADNIPYLKPFIIGAPGALIDTGSLAVNALDCLGYSYAIIRTVIGATDAPIIALKLQHSPDNVNWYDITSSDYSIQSPGLPSSGASNTIWGWRLNLINYYRYIRPALVVGTGTNGAYVYILANLYGPQQADSGFGEVANVGYSTDNLSFGSFQLQASGSSFIIQNTDASAPAMKFVDSVYSSMVQLLGTPLSLNDGTGYGGGNLNIDAGTLSFDIYSSLHGDGYGNLLFSNGGSGYGNSIRLQGGSLYMNNGGGSGGGNINTDNGGIYFDNAGTQITWASGNLHLAANTMIAVDSVISANYSVYLNGNNLGMNLGGGTGGGDIHMDSGNILLCNQISNTSGNLYVGSPYSGGTVYITLDSSLSQVFSNGSGETTISGQSLNFAAYSTSASTQVNPMTTDTYGNLFIKGWDGSGTQTGRVQFDGNGNPYITGYNVGGSSLNSIISFNSGGTPNITNLPTSSSGLSTGDIWNNGGVLHIV